MQITSRPPASTVETQASFSWLVGPRQPARTVCALDGGQAVACTAPWRYSGLGVGVHHFTVRAFDSSGVLIDRASDSWTIEPRRL